MPRASITGELRSASVLSPRLALITYICFCSGDLGYVDAEGFLYISDRAKDIIIRGGENSEPFSALF